MKGTIFKGILLILFLGVGETAVYSQQQQRKDTLVSHATGQEITAIFRKQWKRSALLWITR